MAEFQPFDKPALDARPIRAICVGAGLVGLHFAHRFREFGKGIDFQIYERNSEGAFVRLCCELG
jgi:cation diffusion facilitator CzcD-associated flavoprotein CzcO